MPAAADGTLLVGLEVPDKLAKELPTVQVSELPGSGRLAAGDLEQALVVGATPEPLRGLVEGASWSADEGVVVTMRGEIPIHFGDGARADAKWAAAAAILADPKLDSVAYLDVRVPERPAVGGSGEGVVAPPAATPPPTDVATPDPVAPAPEPVVATDPAATSTTAPTSP